MGRDYDNEIIEDDLDRLVRQAFGVDEDQLLKNFLLAQTEIKEDQIPPEPEDGFEQLVKKMKERGIQPKYIHAKRTSVVSVSDSESGASSKSDALQGGTASERTVSKCTVSGERTGSRIRRPRKLKTIVKVALIAAVLMAMVLGMGITSIGRRRYTFNVTERDLSGYDIMYNKGNIASPEDMLEAAYQTIQDELGIDVLKLGYVPEDMRLEKITITKNRAVMFFNCNGNALYVRQQKRLEGSSYNYVSDRKRVKEINNDLLKQKIVIEANEVGDQEKEYGAQITTLDSYYVLEGIIEEQEFERMIANLYYEEKNGKVKK